MSGQTIGETPFRLNVMKRRYYVIDAFASESFQGNPAAVVLDTEGLTVDLMQSIAAEFNLSETTFVLPPATDASQFRFRWFTPTIEVRMCGHATVAAALALSECGRLGEDVAGGVAFQVDSLSGPLGLHLEEMPRQPDKRIVWLDMPVPRLTPLDVQFDRLAPLLGVSSEDFDPTLAIVRTNDDDILAFLRGFQTLHAAKPDFTGLHEFQKELGIRGVCLATTQTVTPSIHVQSRFFAPAAGINEDPVTGSVHGPLSTYLVMQKKVPLTDGLAGLECVQAIAGGRGGVVFALVQPQDDGHYEVRIGGQARIVMEGELHV